MAKGSRSVGAGTTERTIYFYRIHNGLQESGEPKPFPSRDVLDRLQRDAVHGTTGGGRSR